MAGTNPEELVAAAHADCFTMKLRFVLGESGFVPESLETTAYIHFENGAITGSHLLVKATVPQYESKGNLVLIHTDKEMQIELEGVMQKMLREFENYFLMRSEILKVLLKIFIIYLSRKMKMQPQEYGFDKDVEMVKKFMDLLKKNYASKKLVVEYADELCVTPNYLNTIIKKMSGFAASHHIQQYIILEAKRKALYSGLRMKELPILWALMIMPISVNISGIIQA